MLKLKPNQNYPMPDWDYESALAEKIGIDDKDKQTEFWNTRGQEWVRLLTESFGSKYRLYVSSHFWLICDQKLDTSQRLIAWTEQVYLRLIKGLGEIAINLDWRVPIIVTSDEEHYYTYASQFISDGEHGTSGGVYLNGGYGHFIFCFKYFSSAESVIAHELTHVLLNGLPLPLWLEEGIAQLAEFSVTGRHNTQTEDILETIESFWTHDTIQDFWSGLSFDRQDEGQMHSYHLSLVLTMKLTNNKVRFNKFVLTADATDAGESALFTTYGLSLGDLVSDYLGEGNWTPKSPNKAIEPTPMLASEQASTGVAHL